MAYILEINERIIDTKTNPKPIQKLLKNNCRIVSLRRSTSCIIKKPIKADFSAVFMGFLILVLNSDFYYFRNLIR